MRVILQRSAAREPRPGALQILISRLSGVADEMGAVLRRAAFSPNIKERADCSAALFTADGELLAQAEHIPVHLGSMPASVAAAIAAVGCDVEPGDQIVVNDPFAGGTHLNDITVVAPCFVGGALVGWVANRAHHADVGGTAPGLDAARRDRDRARKACGSRRRGSTPSRSAAARWPASRTPDERRGDLDAQRGANALGVDARLVEHRRRRALDEIVDYGERRMRAAIADVPDGRGRSTTCSTPPARVRSSRRPTRDRASTRAPSTATRVTFDFTGTDAQRPATSTRSRR